MSRRFFWMLVPIVFLAPGSLRAQDPKKDAPSPYLEAVKKSLEPEYADLEKLYKHLHANPELSLREEQTAKRLAKELKALGFEVTESVGSTPKQPAYGVVGVLKNGKGPTIMVRTDLDALPITEQTGLPYASKVRTRDKHGNEVGVMHACGHDMHMACWVGTARVLVALKDKWQGTLVFIGQPAEEVGAGARLMLADGLFKRFPKPDYCLALHCDGRLPHGHLGYTEGLALANVDSVDIVVKGKGGHGAAPHMTVDPIVLAARMILDLQTIVSREVDPINPTVVTVGSIHGGTKHNIIPNEVKMQLTVRTTTDAVRKQVHEAIARIVKAAAKGADAPEPEIHIDPGEFTPALVNDGPLTRKITTLFKQTFGAERVADRPLILGGEDFSRYGREGVPIFLFWLGTSDPDRVAEAKREKGRPLPLAHTDQYAPILEPTLRHGVVSMSLAVLNLVGK